MYILHFLSTVSVVFWRELIYFDWNMLRRESGSTDVDTYNHGMTEI